MAATLRLAAQPRHSPVTLSSDSPLPQLVQVIGTCTGLTSRSVLLLAALRFAQSDW
jgi:hypothetical protein